MKKGTEVKYKNETPEEKAAREAGVKLVILWTAAPRVMVEEQIPGLFIYPVAIVNLADLELVQP